MAQTTKRADFEAIFPSLAQDILAHAKRYNLPANALEWFENVSATFLIIIVLLND
jgi:farnesyl diphosphate synthase